MNYIERDGMMILYVGQAIPEGWTEHEGPMPEVKMSPPGPGPRDVEIAALETTVAAMRKDVDELKARRAAT